MVRDLETCYDVYMARCDGHLMRTFVVPHVCKTKLWKTSKQHSCRSWSMYGILCIMINQEQIEWVFLNVDCFIIECGLIYIGKWTMICLHTFQGVFRWKQLLVIVTP